MDLGFFYIGAFMLVPSVMGFLLASWSSGEPFGSLFSSTYLNLCLRGEFPKIRGPITDPKYDIPHVGPLL